MPIPVPPPSRPAPPCAAAPATAFSSAPSHLRKKIRSLAKAGNTEEALKLVAQFQSQIDRAAKKGVVHKTPPPATRSAWPLC